jgi:hypothetical protein
LFGLFGCEEGSEVGFEVGFDVGGRDSEDLGAEDEFCAGSAGEGGEAPRRLCITDLRSPVDFDCRRPASRYV